MKLRMIVCLLALLTLISCKKEDNLPEDNGCIERIITPMTAHDLSPADLATAKAMLKKYNIDDSYFRYTRYVVDSLQTLYPPYEKVEYKHVLVSQYVNGLPIFYGQLAFHFRKDSLYFAGHPSPGTSLDNTPHLSLPQLRGLFISNVKSHHDQERFNTDSCVKAEFAYYNVNAGISYQPEKLIKAWKVTPKNQNYPVAFFEDDHGKLIYYHNGIVFFN